MSQPSPPTALVTGASSGIGLAIARQLLQRNTRIIAVARKPEKAAIDDPNFIPLAIDLADIDALSRVLAKTCREHSVDYFVHCAGQGLFGSIEQFSSEQIDHNIRVNLTSALVLAHYLVPPMRARKSGRIVFIGSESAWKPGRKGSLYCSGKFGLRGLALSLREDCSRDGIPVTLINPGMTRTPFFDGLGFRPGADPSNAIDAQDVATLVMQLLDSNPQMVVDEINLSPRNKSIDFGPA